MGGENVEGLWCRVCILWSYGMICMGRRETCMYVYTGRDDGIVFMYYDCNVDMNVVYGKRRYGNELDYGTNRSRHGVILHYIGKRKEQGYTRAR